MRHYFRLGDNSLGTVHPDLVSLTGSASGVFRASNKTLALGGGFIASLGRAVELGYPYAQDRDCLEAKGDDELWLAVSEGRSFRTEPISGSNRGGSARYLSKLLGGSSSR